MQRYNRVVILDADVVLLPVVPSISVSDLRVTILSYRQTTEWCNKMTVIYYYYLSHPFPFMISQITVLPNRDNRLVIQMTVRSSYQLSHLFPSVISLSQYHHVERQQGGGDSRWLWGPMTSCPTYSRQWSRCHSTPRQRDNRMVIVDDGDVVLPVLTISQSILFLFVTYLCLAIAWPLSRGHSGAVRCHYSAVNFPRNWHLVARPWV